MERVAPRQIMYENQLPLAIESKSQRRLFFPEGGSTYGPTGGGTHPNIIRIPINADSLLDVQHSYLQFKLNSTGGGTIAPDVGVPMIKRLRVESAGTTLEDIDNYNKLYGGVLFPCQASAGALQEATLTTSGVGTASNALSNIGNDAGAAALTDGAVATAALGGFTGADADQTAQVTAAKAAATTAVQTAINNAITAQNTAIVNRINAMTIESATTIASAKHSVTNSDGGGVPNGEQAGVTYNVPLVSALFNMEKYLPLVMMNAGLTIELELATSQEVGVAADDDTAKQGNRVPTWTITDVRYVAHLIDLQRDFYDRMRMVMEGSGGVLQLAGTTYRHYSGQTAAGAGKTIINIPSRIKSIKSVFFTQTTLANIANQTHFSTSNSIPNGLTEYQFRVGSVVYPPTSVKAEVRTGTNVYQNKGEFYNELRKSWGNLGAYDGQGVLLNRNTYLSADNAAEAISAAAPATPQFNPFGLDFESFAKIAAENGINTADRALPMSLELTNNANAVACLVDVFVMCDAIFYVNLDGSVSVSI